jgi:hypothetical protein
LFIGVPIGNDCVPNPNVKEEPVYDRFITALYPWGPVAPVAPVAPALARVDKSNEYVTPSVLSKTAVVPSKIAEVV